MTNFEKITKTPEALAGFLAALPTPGAPWDDAFHKENCIVCFAENCEDAVCPAPELRWDMRKRVAWWLGLEA